MPARSALNHLARVDRRSFLAGLSAAAMPFILPGCNSSVITSDLPMPSSGSSGATIVGAEATVPASPSVRRPMPEIRPALPTVEPLVRVRLTQADLAHGPLRISSHGWLRAHQPIIGRLGRVLKGPLEISYESRGWVVRDAAGVRLSFDGWDTLEIAPPSDQPQRLDFDGNTYPGTLRLVSRSDVDLRVVDVVSHVMMEQYLPGVISKELYNTWKPHTHLAQTVAARSYAASEVAYWSTRRHFDVVAGQASQAYVGLTAHRTSNDAVRQTRGEVIGYQNLLVTAYYSSCCGGRSASAIDAFGPGVINEIAPLEARPLNECCRWAPMYTWRADRSVADASKRLSAWASEEGYAACARLGDIAAIEPTAVYSNGRAARYIIKNARGDSAELPAERFREAMNFRERGLGSPKASLKSADVAASLSRGSFTFNGRGFGHGVGLRQHGAEAQARQGANYRSILNHYYPSASITRSYT